MGLVGYYLGLQWAFLLYIINFAVIIVLGRIAYKVAKGQNTELIIELHDFRRPNMNVIVKQTWFRGKEFVNRALPLIVVIGIFLQILIQLNILNPINGVLAPVTVFWLGLPVGVGIFLLYGVLRKELTLVLLGNFVLALDLTMPQYMSPLQMIVFCLVIMLYVPCMATIVMMGKEAGWKFAGFVTLVEIGVALLLGGLINWGAILLSRL
jgi:ferrous iron transport protein B